MNPQEQFCPNEKCPGRGKTGQGNIVSHSYRRSENGLEKKSKVDIIGNLKKSKRTGANDVTYQDKGEQGNRQ